MKLEINTTVKHNNFGVGKVVNYLPGDDTYLVYFPLQHDLHNGRHPYEGIPGYDTNQYWWCKLEHLTVISEEEYNREKEVKNMNIKELMNKFKVGDTIKYNGTQTIPYFVHSATLVEVLGYTDNNKVEVRIICHNYTNVIGHITQFDIELLKDFTHHTIKCSCCGENITTEAILDHDGDIFCNDCLSTAIDNGDMMRCDCCREYISLDNTTYIESEDKTVCYDCYDEYYRTCEVCGNTYHIDTMYYHDHHDCWYCECCYPGDNEFQPVYNQLVELEKGKRYFGMELEVENYGNYYYDITDQIMDIMGKDTILEIKEDGSLDAGGFEIVFQPLSEEYINSDEFRDKLTRLSSLLQRNDFYKEAPNGGLHIHTTRLGGEDIADLYTLAKFFETELKQINARFSSNWCRIGGYTTDYCKNKNTNDEIQGETRYQWWNTTNYHTIECRAFDSSLDVDTILNDYNFVINAFKYRCDKKVNNVTWDMLMGKSTHITKTSKVYSVDTLRYIKQMYKTNSGKVRAIKHIMSIMDKELRVQLDALNYDKVVTISNELRQLNNIMSNSVLLKDCSMEYIARISRVLNIEELNEYVRHL